MAANDDGPEFSYAFGSAAWNPAHRPHDESESTLTPVEPPIKEIPAAAEMLVVSREGGSTEDPPAAGVDFSSPESQSSHLETTFSSDATSWSRFEDGDETSASQQTFECQDTSKNAHMSPQTSKSELAEWSQLEEDEGSRAQETGIADAHDEKVGEVRESTVDTDGHEDCVDGTYDFQGQETFLEEARQESAKEPLVADAADFKIDWDSTEDSNFDLGGATAIQAPETNEKELMGQLNEGSVEGTALLEHSTQAPTSTGEEPSFDWADSGDQGFDLGKAPVEDTIGSAAAPATQPTNSNQTSNEQDLTAMWQAVFDDDDLLPDSAANGFGFLDDGDGFLDDVQQPVETFGASEPSSDSAQFSKYTPTSIQPQPQPPDQNAYLPRGPEFTDLSHLEKPMQSAAYSTPSPYQVAYAQQPPQRPSQLVSAESFVDKAKGGYHSPYDLPEDIVKPRRRPAHHSQTAPAVQPLQPPPRSSSMPLSPTMAPPQRPTPPSASYNTRDLTPPSSGHSNLGINGGAVSGSVLSKPPSAGGRTPSGDFFAELPVVQKTRYQPAAGRHIPQPQAALPTPPPSQGPPMGTRSTSSYSLTQQQSAPPLISQLRQPERILPYAEEPPVAAQRSATAPAPPPSSRYSPALPITELSKPRYSPAPPVSAATASRYSPAPSTAAPPAAPHQRYHSEPIAPPQARSHPQPYAPRTSSPLAYSGAQKSSSTDGVDLVQQKSEPSHSVRPSVDRLTSSVHTPLEPVAENEPFSTAPPSSHPLAAMGFTSPRQATPPPQNIRSGTSSAVSSPRKKSNYIPSHHPAPSASDPGFAPPQRSHTSSPGASLKHAKLAMSSAERPASAHGAVRFPAAAPSVIQGPRRRATFAQDLNMIPPQDERAQDPLERWRGAPIFTWGSAGLVVLSFPKHVQKYSSAYIGPAIEPTQNEARARNIKDVFPLPETLAKFPGPLRKGRKKELVAWIKTYTDSLESGAQGFDMRSGLPITPDVRTQEKIMLWKLMTILVENDGQLEGIPVVDEAVQKLLSDASFNAVRQSDGLDLNLNASSLQPEAFDPNALNVLRNHLTNGEREKAVWHAVDQRLWAHGLLIASTLPKDIWKQVVQEFVRKEIRKAGNDTEPLAALYQVFAGNWEESIDELVSVSARAGFQMVSTSSAGGAPKDALAGLNKWRETLALVLHNRSSGDFHALLSLGRLLRGYGRIEAAHICFLFARSVAAFKGRDDPQGDFCLLGGDPLIQGSDFGNDLESILLSEVYEYALTVANSPHTPIAHLQAYKLYHAEVLADAGYRSEAQAYCDAINTIIHSKTRPSPYFNAFLMQRLDELTRKLSQTAVDNSSSWKPSMDKVSSSLFAKFNSFVAGDDSDAASNASGTGQGGDPSQFGRFSGGDISRQGSDVDIYSAMNGTIAVPPPSNSKYAPPNAYASRPSLDHTRGGLTRYDSAAQTGHQPRTSLESTRTSTTYMANSGLVNSFGIAGSPKRAASYNPSNLAHARSAGQLQESSPSPNVFANLHDPAASHSPYVHSPYQSSSPAEPAGEEYQPQSPPVDIPRRQSSFGYLVQEPARFSNNEPEKSRLSPTSNSEAYGAATSYDPPGELSTSYEPPSYQPYEPEIESAGEEESKSAEQGKPKKKSFMDDDDDDELLKRAEALKKQQKSDADRAADEAFRKAAEADAAKPLSVEKKGWFGGWFKRDSNASPGPIKAKLGEENSFVYDPELKRWVNKATGAAPATPTVTAPPPPKSAPLSTNLAVPHPPHAGGGPSPRSLAPPITPSAPPARASSVPPAMLRQDSQGSSTGAPSGVGSGPPSRPGTSMSNASDLDDLLGAPAPRRAAAAKKAAKRGRYVDVMANAKQ